ncbi:MAG: tetratricopeptide repeat protein, partial [Gemmataceae bacterium]|nr:tetratricopeptide repeat protein [Gemmataceae bacterium]
RPDDAVLRQRAGQAYLDLHAMVPEAQPDTLIETGLRHLVISRDLCPNLAQPHVRLGEWRHRLARGDDAVRYFERAVRVLPDEHELWFALGRAYLSAGRHADSQSIWRHYLVRSRKRLKSVLKLGAEAWGETALREKVLPPLPSIWREAATTLHPDPRDESSRRPYLEQAARLLVAKSDRTAQDWYDLATIQSQLGRIDEAIASYRATIEVAPDRRAAYNALVNLLRRHQRFGEARDVLRDWQARFPNDETAANLIRVVEREMLLHEP